MKQLFTIAIAATVLGVAFSYSLSFVTSDNFIREINEKATTWTARRNFENYTTEELRMLAGVISIYGDDNSTELLTIEHEVDAQKIPASFDARKKWTKCKSLKSIRNQGKCGSCWAFAAAEVMSDRLCIFSSGKKSFVFSPEELISCCKACGKGCKGGNLIEPFKFWVKHGIPSGGDQGSKVGCRPYTAAKSGKTPACHERCVSGYKKSWAKDIRHGVSAYKVKSTVTQMQHEIMTHGPIEAYMMVYEDFYNYGKGIYKHTSGKAVGGHAVKIIGWGTQKKVPYWIVANSWGKSWGEGGFFRIIRGKNNAKIESYLTAGSPNIKEK